MWLLKSHSAEGLLLPTALSQLSFVFDNDDIENCFVQGFGQKGTFGTRSPFYIVYIHKNGSKFASLLKEIFYCRFFKSLSLFSTVDLRAGIGGIPGLFG